jgi:two-component system, response regulator
MDDNFDVLLVEDSATDADLTLRALRKNNKTLTIKHIEDGEEALNFIFARPTQSAPRLILMDLQLPKLNGTEILKEIKNNDKTKMIPVVMLTSSNQPDDVMNCYSLGANAYMVKPLDFDVYISQVATAIQFWLDINCLPGH